MRALIAVCSILPWACVQAAASDAGSVTREAGEKLESLQTRYQDKLHYQTATREDRLAYESANHDLAAWYVKALIRSRVRGLLRQTRSSLQRQRAYELERKRSPAALKQRREAWVEHAGGSVPESAPGDRNPLAPSLTGGAITDYDDDSFPLTLDLSNELTAVTGFVDRLMNEGIHVSLGWLRSRWRVEIPAARVHVALDSPWLAVRATAHALRRGPAIPFPGIETANGGETLALAASRSIPVLDIESTVDYRWDQRKLGCSLGKRILEIPSWVLGDLGIASGAVTARFARTWLLAGAEGQENTEGRIDLSLSI